MHDSGPLFVAYHINIMDLQFNGWEAENMVRAMANSPVLTVELKCQQRRSDWIQSGKTGSKEVLCVSDYIARRTLAPHSHVVIQESLPKLRKCREVLRCGRLANLPTHIKFPLVIESIKETAAELHHSTARRILLDNDPHHERGGK